MHYGVIRDVYGTLRIGAQKVSWLNYRGHPLPECCSGHLDIDFSDEKSLSGKLSSSVKFPIVIPNGLSH
ncbi:hypothetical protein TNCV_1275101 [Trichonephila clavipes]|nr:hypothetical protein TNCV_1275101 [Trichonephila clavipes]